jgi:hypothetical protein
MAPELTQIITMLCLLSVAVERVTAMFISLSALDTHITNPKVSNAAKQAAATIFGALIYAFSGEAQTLFGPFLSGWDGAAVVGLMTAGGSGFWNGILKLLSATAVKVVVPETIDKQVIAVKDLPK